MQQKHWVFIYGILLVSLLTAGLSLIFSYAFCSVFFYVMCLVVGHTYENVYARFGYLIWPNALIENLHVHRFEKKYLLYLPRAFDDGFYTLEGIERNCYATNLNKYRAVEYNDGYQLMLETLQELEVNEKFTVKDLALKLNVIAKINSNNDKIFYNKNKLYQLRLKKEERKHALERMKSS
ncbi:hypothetical protein UA32_12265 [Photobacterium angustum]|uniref:Uncharacterized protein n=1 Tax=Photobacterium angustum TaxID=661 RepID=A0ABX5GYG2_PHOAN|nr:hypothetical protein [Photobacterium angustum]KJG37726.1 hypothetical protein UA32_12265 [Photobacterium angustum]PSX03939.1 hypothetical protein C0W27_20815 [Photobacterium angustum]